METISSREELKIDVPISLMVLDVEAKTLHDNPIKSLGLPVRLGGTQS